MKTYIPQKKVLRLGGAFCTTPVESVKHLCGIIQNSEKILVFGSGGFYKFRKGRSAVNVKHMGHP